MHYCIDSQSEIHTVLSYAFTIGLIYMAISTFAVSYLCYLFAMHVHLHKLTAQALV